MTHILRPRTRWVGHRCESCRDSPGLRNGTALRQMMCTIPSSTSCAASRWATTSKVLMMFWLWSMLLCGDRTILQHEESSAWYVVLGVAAGCCTLAIPVVRHTVGFAHNYFTLSPPESFQEWCPLVIRSPDHWAAASFVWASPLHQLQTDPTKELLAHTKKRIVIMIDGAVSDLVKHAAQCAFYSIGKAAMLKMADKLDIEVDASLPSSSSCVC